MAKLNKSAIERTFVMVKPDGVRRGLMARVFGVFEEKGYRLVGIKIMQLTREIAAKHYAEHEGKPFYPALLEFITSGPVLAMVWEGPNIVKGARALMGATNPLEAAPGSIRGRYAAEMSYNVVHGSDSPESAQREIALYFTAEELLGQENK